jgi:hypothetical protein
MVCEPHRLIRRAIQNEAAGCHEAIASSKDRCGRSRCRGWNGACGAWSRERGNRECDRNEKSSFCHCNAPLT